jgi:alpha-glucosidase
VRWVALAAFHPFFRTHSSGDHGDQEPWSFGEEFAELAKQFIELRYQLLPYMYTTFWQYVQQGTPFLRPLCFLDQSNIETYQRMAEFGVGDQLLVCPVTQAGVEGRWMYLPKGQWYYYWTDELREGGAEVWAAAGLERIPVYVRAGAVVPMYPVMQYVGEQAVQELTLHVYHKEGRHTSTLYDDGGEGYGYEQGQATVRTYTTEGTATGIALRQQTEGDYQPSWKTCRVVLHGLVLDTAYTATVDGVAVEVELVPGIGESQVLQVVVPAGFAELLVALK